jgi:hypothetical protein
MGRTESTLNHFVGAVADIRNDLFTGMSGKRILGQSKIDSRLNIQDSIQDGAIQIKDKGLIRFENHVSSLKERLNDSTRGDRFPLKFVSGKQKNIFGKSVSDF